MIPFGIAQETDPFESPEFLFGEPTEKRTNEGRKMKMHILVLGSKLPAYIHPHEEFPIKRFDYHPEDKELIDPGT